MREGAFIGVATMPQLWTLRLILNAAALTAASPTLLFRPLYNAARLNRSASELLVCDDILSAVKCASVSRWACRKRRRKNSPCMRADVLMKAEKRNVLIVSELLPIGVDLTLCSNTQRAVKVLGVCEVAILQHVAA